MPAFEAFIGPAYADATAPPGADDCINLYLETGGDRVLRGTPGLAAFATLPTSPIRGFWRGTSGQLFVVAGAVYYQVFANGTYTARATVNNDGLPVQMFSNEQSVLVLSGGDVYIDLGTYTWAGTVSTAGAVVTLTAGNNFAGMTAGYSITINAVVYTVLSVDGPGQVTLTGSAGTQTGVAWGAAGVASFQKCYYQNGVGTVTTSGTAVTSITGATFDASNVLPGNTFLIGGINYTVASVTDTTDLVLTTSAGTQGTTYTGLCSVTGAGFTVASTGGANNFSTLAAYGTITIAGVPYTISSVTDAYDLVLTTAAPLGTGLTWTGIIGVAYAAAYPVTASAAAFLDGYFIVSQPSGRQMNSSNLNDGTQWSPLNFATKEGYPGPIAQLLADHEQLWVFGEETTEVWMDTGQATFPFQRNTAGFVHMGCVAQFSTVRLAGSVAWVGGDPRGQPSAYVANGFIPARVSTHAVERAWAEYATVSDAVAYSYTDRGHDFWVISFPTGNETWVFDATIAAWHKRLYWTGTAFARHRVAFCAFVFGQYIGGDYATGELYTVSEDLSTDAGTAITRVRSAPYTADPRVGEAGPDSEFAFFAKLEVDLEPLTSNPTAVFDRSDNGGNTFLPAPAGLCNTLATAVTSAGGANDFRLLGAGMAITINLVAYTILSITDATHLTLTATAGTQTGVAWLAQGRAANTIATDAYLTRLVWRRLGKSRRPGKLGDRVFRLTLTSTTADKIAIANARVEAS